MGNVNNTIFTEKDFNIVQKAIPNKIRKLSVTFDFYKNPNKKGILIDTLLNIVKLDKEQNFKDLFKIFAIKDTEEIDKINFIIIYYIFTSTDYNILKKKFFAELFFYPEKKEISLEEYIFTSLKYFNQYSHQKLLYSQNFLKTLSNKKNNILKTTFIENIDLFKSIIKDIYIKRCIESTVEKFNKRHNYICNCNISKKSESVSDTEGILRKNFSFIQCEFAKIESNNNGVFPISQLADYMKELNIDKNFINIIEMYFMKKISRNFIDFQSFINFIISFSICNTSEEKENLIFDIVNYLDKNKILIELFPNSNDTNISLNNNIIDQISNINTKFIDLLKQYNSPEFLSLINKIPEICDKISIIPFIFFRIKPFFPEHIKILYNNFVFKKQKYEDILKDWIINNDIFYAVDYKFIKHLNKYTQSNSKSNIVPKINLTSISNLNHLLKKKLIFMKDFIIFPESIYIKYIKRWFLIDGIDIPLKRIIYPFNNNVEELQPNCALSEDKKTVYEIEVHPLFVRYLTFKDIYKDLVLKGEELKPGLVDIILSIIIKNKMRKNKNAFSFSRKDTLNKLLSIIKDSIKNEKEILDPKYYVYSNYLYDCDMINENESMENLNFGHSFLILIDSKVHLNNENNITYKEKLEGQLDEYFKDFGEDDSNLNISFTSNSVFHSRFSSFYSKNSSFLLRFEHNGNYSYLNAVLQSIINLDYIYKYIYLIDGVSGLYINKYLNESNNGDIFFEFLKIIRYLYRKEQHLKEDELIYPKRFLKACCNINPMMKDNSTNYNAVDFLKFLIDNLHIEFSSLNIFSDIPNISNYSLNEYINVINKIEDGNFQWANFISTNPGIINALFSFQINEQYFCPKCKNVIDNFTINKMITLDIPKNEMINLTLIINRLPYMYKTNYDKEKSSSTLKEDTKFNTLTNSLNSKIIKQKENLLDTNYPYKMNIVINRYSKIKDILTIITEKENLELEKYQTKNIENDIIQSEFKKYILEKNKVESNITLIPLIIELPEVDEDNINKIKFLDPLKTIDDLLLENDTVYIFEALNYNGIKKLSKNKNDIKNLIDFSISTKYASFKGTSSKKSEIDGSFKSILYHSKFGKISSVKDDLVNYYNYISYYGYNVSALNLKKDVYFFEFPIKVLHYYQDTQASVFFDSFERTKISLPFDIILVNNIEKTNGQNHNISAYDLYDLIWEKYRKYLRNPNKDINQLWWKNQNTTNVRICYPFMLKICYFDNQKKLKCPFCNWYNFCNGCILDPFSKGQLIFDFNYILVVEWCKNIFLDEFLFNMFNFTNKEEKKENDKEDNTQTNNNDNENDYSNSDIKKCINKEEISLNHNSFFTDSKISNSYTSSKIVNNFENEDDNLKIDSIIDESKESDDIVSYNNMKLDKNKNSNIENNINEILNQFFEKKQSDFICENCTENVYLLKKQKITNYSPILIIVLDRFKQKGNRKIKIKTKINFAQNIVIDNKNYDLSAIINQIGSNEDSHYTTISKINEKWFYFDDSHYDEIDITKICTSNACVLIYSKTDLNECRDDFMYFNLMENLLSNINLDKINSNIQNDLEPLHFLPSKFFVGEPVKVDERFGIIHEIKYNSDNNINSFDIEFKNEIKNYSYNASNTFQRVQFTIGSEKKMKNLFMSKKKKDESINSKKVSNNNHLIQDNDSYCFIF